ncbi:Chromosome 5 open reading frame 43 [Nesidiocoris tenuis]|uniref:Small integral membrane protein 15 n=1 Tax=Nesidiocoris tenuis TaxID=355587 RepID=A0ABN7AGF8_9HEMI|nr:Chromosome 5 open reading frame 43 [Nesidiocoris tenuis]
MEPPATPTASPAVGLNLDKNTWEGWINSFIVWAAQDPSGFLTTILLILSPFLAISLLLAWRLSRILKVQKKENSKKIRKETNTSRLRKNKNN